jgi:hypothetical protein
LGEATQGRDLASLAGHYNHQHQHSNNRRRRRALSYITGLRTKEQSLDWTTMVKGVWRALAMALVLVALYGLASTHGLDVAKSQQGWRPAGEGSTGQLLLEDSLEALVVRDGAVTASFSVESSLLQAMTFELPSMFNAPFLSLFPRLYVELAQQSHFLVRHDSPVEVVNFGVVDGVGQSSRSGTSSSSSERTAFAFTSSHALARA